MFDSKKIRKEHKEKKSSGLAEGTLRSEKRALDSLKRFCLAKESEGGYDESLESIIPKIKKDPDVVYDFIDDFVKFEKKRQRTNRYGVLIKDENGNTIPAISINTLKLRFIYIRKFLDEEGIKLDKKSKVKEIFGKSEKHQRIGVTHEQIESLILASDRRMQAAIMIQSSTGMRVGELRQIRIKDLEKLEFEGETRYKINIPAKITKTKTGRITFVSKEAEPYLEWLIKDRKPDDVILNLCQYSILVGFQRGVRKAELEKKYEHSTHNTITSHSMRAFFITQMGKVDGFFGHQMAGHSYNLDQYDRYTDEEKLEAYLKGEKHLQIFNRVNQKQMKNLERQLEEQQKTIEILQEQVLKTMVHVK